MSRQLPSSNTYYPLAAPHQQICPQDEKIGIPNARNVSTHNPSVILLRRFVKLGFTFQITGLLSRFHCLSSSPPHYPPLMNILVVEDQPKFLSFIKDGLESQGMTVETATDGDRAYEMASAGDYDILVMDIMLPGKDGLEILRSLRENNNNVPVILVTARSGLNDRIEGLNVGADDYLAKPFYIEELIARIQTVVRRASGASSHTVSAGPLNLDLTTRRADNGQKTVNLTNREFLLLEILMRTPDKALSRTQIFEHVWNYHSIPSTNLVDVYIRRLRNKIDRSDRPSFIKSVRGVGYRLIA
jgi:DNA-binding response OmpR family regulator